MCLTEDRLKKDPFNFPAGVITTIMKVIRNLKKQDQGEFA